MKKRTGIIKEIEEALKEVQAFREGKVKLKTAEEFLAELKGKQKKQVLSSIQRGLTHVKAVEKGEIRPTSALDFIKKNR